MRFSNLNPTLLENKVQYRQMLEPMVRLGVIDASAADGLVNFLRKNLKRNDRIVWWLRNYRAIKLQQWVNEQTPTDGQDAQALKQTAIAQVEKITKQQWNSPPWVTQYWQQNFDQNSPGFQHTVSMLNLSKEMDAVTWDQNLHLTALHNQLHQAERQWEQNRKQVVKAKPEDKILIDYGNAAWMILPRTYCRDEGDAMGHCGNEGDPREGDRVLSYRSKVADDNQWRPHLTFILDKGGYLGEMKGRANSKPSAKYHDVIVDLLQNPIVKGIKGGGYAPENNFALADLPEETQTQLADSKPELLDMRTLYDLKGLTETTKNQITDLLDRYKLDYKWMDEFNSVYFGKFKNLEDLVKKIYGHEDKWNWSSIRIAKLVDLLTNTDREDIAHNTRIRAILDANGDLEDDLNSVAHYAMGDIERSITDTTRNSLRRLARIPDNRPVRLKSVLEGNNQLYKLYMQAITDQYIEDYVSAVDSAYAQWRNKNEETVFQQPGRAALAILVPVTDIIDNFRELDGSFGFAWHRLISEPPYKQFKEPNLNTEEAADRFADAVRQRARRSA